MIFTILGGSAPSTPVVVEALARLVPDEMLTIRLAGRQRDRLEAVGRACRLLSQGSCFDVEVYGPGEWRAAIEGSNLILIQSRIGNYEARGFDEAFPIEFGIPGDEGLGPGGLSAAYRTWPQLKEICCRIQAHAPKAQTVLLTSPSGLLVRLAALEFSGWPLLATCELPYTTLKALCSIAGEDPDDMTFDYTGVNHLGYLYNLHAKRDLLATYQERADAKNFPSAALLARLNAFPLKYLRLHYEQEEVVQEQRDRMVPRAHELGKIASHALECFHFGDEAVIREALSQRRADWYEFAVIPLVLFHLKREVRQPIFLTSADDAGEVRERAFRVRKSALAYVPPKAPATDEVEDLVNAFARYERVAAEAVLAGTEEALSSALALHPWVKTGSEHELASIILSQPFERRTSEGEKLWQN
ncbi:hypothetical protein [Terriglobus saanensis]|uniref:Glycoside hydrolase family 4 n=1 Tax=Terriglobus saanensis (strain ATCC BAA-1853 / DSM 23119 / SP1PR4) TaxID=401053 RepID=E8UYH0_TERSS|nr:hypothetical protein [Terriglobus saanensis]ADV82058.1 hypothetical protein AciPR4_1233 [Terriglobus saanensis SP1PR4]